jgi:hypothetical protein
VKFESNRSRLNVPHAGQLKRREDFAIGRSSLDARSNLFQQPFARRFFQQADQRFNFWAKLNKLRIEFCLRSRNARKAREKAEVRDANECAGSRCLFQEGASGKTGIHDCVEHGANRAKWQAAFLIILIFSFFVSFE